MGLTLASRIIDELDGELEIKNLANPTIIFVSLPLDRRRKERREKIR